MPETNLRAALTAAGIQPGELVDLIKVDERTVRRWLAGGTPYARHRQKLARALNTSQHQLWPHLATSPAGDATEQGAPATDTLIAHTNPRASDTPTTEGLVANALTCVDLIDATGHLVEQPGLVELLTAKGQSGCHVRILTSLPSRALALLVTTPGVEVRLSEADEEPVIHRGDDQTLTWLTFPTAGHEDPTPLLLEVRHDHAAQTFDRLADHYDQVWKLAQPIKTTAELDQHLLDYDIDNTEREPAADRRHPSRVHDTQRDHPAPRRWPGRSD